jgi:hypothetical protein
VAALLAWSSLFVPGGKWAVAPAVAAEEIALAWDDCIEGGAALLDMQGECDFNLGFVPLFPSFRVPQSTPADVIGVELVIDVQHAGTTLPDWWRMSPGDCRDGALSADGDFSAAPGCADPWAGGGAAQVQGYLVTLPYGQASQARILAVAGVPSIEAKALDAAIVYHAARIRLSKEKSSGAFSCIGCTSGACLVLNGIIVRRLPGSPGGDLTLTIPRNGTQNRVTWNGGQGADCSAVPVRRATWGLVKSLYR